MDALKKVKGLIAFHVGKGVVLGLFVVLLPLFVFGVAQVSHLLAHALIAKKEMPAIEQDFSRQMEAALQKTTAAVNEHVIDQYIALNDSVNTSRVLGVLAEKYGLAAMVAVNKEGVALARTPSPRIGDYVFQTTPWGRSAAQGQTTVLVGEGRNFPLLINAAVPIMNDKEVQGALFGGYLLDDQYALNFKNKYLKPGEEVAFYTPKLGLYGTSFQSLEQQRLLKIYINQGSDVVQQTNSGLFAGHFQLGQTTYHVLNIKLADPNGNVGGMIILVPVSTRLTYGVAIMAGILLSFLVISIRRRKHKSNLRRLALMLAILIITVSGTLVVFAWIINQKLYDLSSTAETIYNSTIAFAPGSDVLQLTSPQLISIKIMSGGEAINTARAVVQFDPQAMRVEDIVLTNSFCDQGLIIEKNIDNNNGSATIACSKANGLVAGQVILADLVIQPLKVGITDLRFGANTLVLANDGLGTDVLRTATNGSYLILDPRKALRDIAPPLFSYSHPNASLWYKNNNIGINWVRAAHDESFSYALDQDPNTVPDDTKVLVNTGIKLAIDKDGVYYFHLKPRYVDGTGPVAHIKLMIDTIPPNPPVIKSSALNVRVGELVRFEFLSQGDNASGVQKNFYVQLDGGVWLPTLPQLYIPFGEGKHTVRLRVFDNAGNFSDTSADIIAQ